MEIGKVQSQQQNINSSTTAATSQKASATAPIFAGILPGRNLFDFTQTPLPVQFPTSSQAESSEEAAYDAYQGIKKQGRIPNLCEQAVVDAAEQAKVDIAKIVQQCKIDADRTQEAAEAGIKISDLDVQYNKEVSVLIAKYENQKLTGKELQEQLEALKIKYLKKDTKDIVPKTATTVTDKQAQQIETAVDKSSKLAVAEMNTARKHSANEAQKQELEQAYTDSIPEAREKVTKAIVEELPKTLDEEAIKKVIKSTEPVDTIERNYASKIIKEADYLTKEEKEEKLKVIGSTPEEIQKIAKENTEKLTIQIIEEIKEVQFKEFQANHKVQLERQENFKTEYKIKNTQQTKLDCKENHFKQMIARLLEVIKNAKSKNNGDKKSQQKAEQARYIKNKIDDKLAAIQSQKRLLENEIQMNERYTALSIMSMEDDYIRNSCSGLFNLN